ncbi:MAG: pyridoxal-phosphate dependent enzyme, partial [Candidatus Limnocylindrales bacterium]
MRLGIVLALGYGDARRLGETIGHLASALLSTERASRAAHRSYTRRPMQYVDSILDLVGETPLVRLARVTLALGPPDRQPLMLAKLEMLNPGGSVKDRIGLPMIQAAERAGRLRPGATIIEPTSGNTGHGLAIVAALRGYRCIFVMADKQSAEKQALLRAYGAEVVLCPANVPPESPESYYSVARRLTRDIPGAFQPDQYHNMENPGAHEATTGPELWRQTDGRLTHLVVPVGTGGTISGMAHYLKAQRADICVVGADPEGSVLSGDVARPYLTEGVGEDFLPGTFDADAVDHWERVSDSEAFAAARRLTREEGILAGESCGTALVAALRVAQELTDSASGKDAVMVVLLPDSGRSYLSKLYNDEWMRVNGLLGTATGRDRIRRILRDGHHGPEVPKVVLARTTDLVSEAIETLERYGISQMPVTERDDDAIAGIVGSINERSLLERAYHDPMVIARTVGEVMDRPLPIVEADASLDEAFDLLSEGAPALVAVVAGRPAGVITKLDLLEYLAHRPR